MVHVDAWSRRVPPDVLPLEAVMIRREVSRPVRTTVALAGVAGVLALAGCAGETSEAEEATTGPAPAATSDTSSGSTGSTGESYVDGTYTADGSYQTPETVESIDVTLTLEGDVVTAVEVVGDPQRRESQQYQSQFIGGIADVVVGRKLDEVSVSRVAGSSLTSGGFTQAVEKIKSDAAV